VADHDRYARLERATAGPQAPSALVDLEALWANARELERRAAPKPIRLASKSLRCRALQQRVLARDGFRGTLAYTLPGRQRRRHRQPGEHGGGGRRHRGHRRLGAVRADAVRRLPRLHAAAAGDVRAAGVPTYRGERQCFL
jgi:D-serine deaminase-like pyridoxal phosphate-dependent protein